MSTLLTPEAASTHSDFDVNQIRGEFPALHQLVHGHPLVYLDNAATTQKPQAVIDAITSYYTHDNANIHRGVHALSERATMHYEDARKKVQHFLNARERAEIIFTRNATEGVNLVAQTFGRSSLTAGDEILISGMEHHCNIVPWQLLCEQVGSVLRVVPITDDGELRLSDVADSISPKTKLIAMTHMSNALGTVTPISDIIELAHQQSIPVLVDAAQSAYHTPIDVQAMDCDFLVLSGHKLYGPTGVGVLYGKREFLDSMPPYQRGGDMILSVTFEKTIFNELPYKFEAGTPDISGVIGLGAAIDWIMQVGLDRIGNYEQKLLEYGTQQLQAIPGLHIIGTAPIKASILSFVLGDIHPHDIGTVLDEEGVAIRTGHHCAQPVMHRFCIPATARASLACYNTKGDIDALVGALHKVIEVFA